MGGVRWGLRMLGVLACAASAAGCTSFDAPEPVMERTASIINVRIDPALPTLGHAQWVGQLCTITLRKYPVCLQHEVRHCLEGKWHGDEPNGDDCY